MVDTLLKYGANINDADAVMRRRLSEIVAEGVKQCFMWSTRADSTCSLSL